MNINENIKNFRKLEKKTNVHVSSTLGLNLNVQTLEIITGKHFNTFLI